MAGKDMSVYWEVRFGKGDPREPDMRPEEWVPFAEPTPAKDVRRQRIEVGGVIDAYDAWTPDPGVFSQGVNAGPFQFHTCIQVCLRSDEKYALADWSCFQRPARAGLQCTAIKNIALG